MEFGFNFKYVKNDSVRVTTVCSMVKDKGCTYSAHARVLKANQFFYLRKWNSVHSCGVSVRISNHPRVGSDMVVDIMATRVRDRPLTRPTDVILDLKDDYGLDINYRVAWLRVEKAKGELLGAHSLSFDQLRWYREAVMQYNLGSYVHIDYDEHNYRLRLFLISFKACIDGFRHCRPLLFLDETFLKVRFKGFLLAATTKDCNQGVSHFT
ncbi:uncharacterized protein LOC114286985 [Camellia sinensis]|uniref:uncharacterized protein LOC114286985 n=1 Tax=Camellia sinensis TaxID=4442 RepID=UPI001035F48A|nr:uncharacterized protein LOC114286985 [Camellia sinensis]